MCVWSGQAGARVHTLRCEVIGLYQLRDFKLARAQMFYFDEAAAARFLALAGYRSRTS